MTQIIFDDRYIVDRIQQMNGVKISHLHTILHKVKITLPLTYADGTPISVWIFQHDNRRRLSISMAVGNMMLMPTDIENIVTLEREIMDYVARSQGFAERRR